MRRKIIFLTMALSLVMILPLNSKAVCSPENIDIDGAYDDWEDCDTMATDVTGEDSNLMYWNNNASQWTSTDPGYDTWTTDDAATLDIRKFKMLNDDSYVYFYMKNNWPMMALKAPDGEYFDFWYFLEDFGEYIPQELESYEFYPTDLPEFDHWMLWSFDVEQDGIYDYYFGAHLTLPESMDEDASDVGLAVYKDTDGDGNFDEELDTKLADIDHTDGATSMDEGANPGSFEFEIKQNIETFYEETGISYGDTVKVRMETRSEIGDTTVGKKYTFDLGAPQNLKAINKKKKKATLKWKKNSNADLYNLKIYTKKGKLVKNLKKITKITKIIKGLKKGKTYKYKVQAIDKRKNTDNIKSSWSTFKRFKTKK